MSVSNNGTDISHNVQISVDSKHDIVVAVEELNIDVEKQENKEKEVITALADKGYYNGDDLLKCKKDHIKTIVAKQKSGSRTGYKDYTKENFKYDKEKDIYK
ncbi:hypothetical protein [Abyssisolibacter fermentans]|uniref:hypothetical protein n=1 Tax=Abyssisolibacter fermentans TaxID=1766203 RepID=UPI00082F2A94|nr:hypothetical protein [Abyssisolibacter fermentans]